jgi:hypothetical protein
MLVNTEKKNIIVVKYIIIFFVLNVDVYGFVYFD